jgi:hypothetical protein
MRKYGKILEYGALLHWWCTSYWHSVLSKLELDIPRILSREASQHIVEELLNKPVTHRGHVCPGMFFTKLRSGPLTRSYWKLWKMSPPPGCRISTPVLDVASFLTPVHILALWLTCVYPHRLATVWLFYPPWLLFIYSRFLADASLSWPPVGHVSVLAFRLLCGSTMVPWLCISNPDPWLSHIYPRILAGLWLSSFPNYRVAILSPGYPYSGLSYIFPHSVTVIYISSPPA